MINFGCPHCERSVAAPDHLAGRPAKCPDPDCAQPCVVPTPTPPERGPLASVVGTGFLGFASRPAVVLVESLKHPADHKPRKPTAVSLAEAREATKGSKTVSATGHPEIAVVGMGCQYPGSIRVNVSLQDRGQEANGP